MKQYIGQKAVAEYNEISGDVHYTREDGSGDTVTKEQFDSMCANEPYDDGMVRIHKWKPAIMAIMAILLANKMKVIEKQFVLGRVDETIIDAYDRASAKLYGTDYEHNINLKHLDDVLKGNTMEDEIVEPAVEETPAVEEAPVVEETPAAEEPAA